MKRNLLFVAILSVAGINFAHLTSGRGFGGGGGGGFHGGGGFGGGGFGGGGGYHGSDFGGGGFGGGGYHGSDFGGGGDRYGGFGGGAYAGGAYHGGGFGAGGFGAGGGYGGSQFHGGSGAGGFNAGFHGEGFDAGGFHGGQFGNQFGGFKPDSNALSAYSSFSGMRTGELPNASRLNSFLGLPTDAGMHQASGFEHPYGYSASARGLTAHDPSEFTSSGASGHEWTGPNGTTVAHGSIGERGAGFGPNGVAAGERGARGTVVEGPNGTTVARGSADERGAAVGPNRAAAGERGASGTAIKGPNGTTVDRGKAGERGAAVGPNGAVAGGRISKGTAVRGPEGNVIAHGSTRNWSAADLRVQGNYARHNFHDYSAFNHNWWHDHPNAWWGGWAAGFWAGASWANINNWFGVDWPIYGYMYGNDLTYVNDNVCLYGEPIATAAEYYDSAEDLAQTGEQANAPSQPLPQNEQQASTTDPDKGQWLPLGVFEAIPADKKSSDMIFQLAVNKAGIIRGNYYDTADKNVQLIQGSVDKETKRVAWIVADKKNIIFDCGLYNLTQPETSVLVHMGKDKQEQWTLVRMQQPPQTDSKNQ